MVLHVPKYLLLNLVLSGQELGGKEDIFMASGSAHWLPT